MSMVWRDAEVKKKLFYFSTRSQLKLNNQEIAVTVCYAKAERAKAGSNK